jgi:hypothetical protein
MQSCSSMPFSSPSGTVSDVGGETGKLYFRTFAAQSAAGDEGTDEADGFLVGERGKRLGSRGPV